MTTTLATALWVTTHWPGARVFPVEGKVPAMSELGKVPWNEAATRDPDQIAAWFSGTRWGVGVTGILTIDCDADEGTSAVDTFGIAVLDGVRWRGNPDRCSFAFAQPTEPFGDGRWEFGEVKGSGYVVLPPSWHKSDSCGVCQSGLVHSYEWVGDWQTLPPLPPEVESVLDAHVRRAGAKPDRTATNPDAEDWETPGTPCSHVRAILSADVAALAAPKSARHEVMEHAQGALLRKGEQGHPGVAEALDEVWREFLRACFRDGDNARVKAAKPEWDRGMDGARILISATPSLPFDMGCMEGETGKRLEDAIFDATPILSDIRQHARASLCAPLAVLGGVLALAAGEAPPGLRLPGDGSMNLYVCLVGEPGTGKSTAWKCAHTLFGQRIARDIASATGEGMVQSFLMTNPDKAERAHTPQVPIDPPQVVMFVDELDQWTSVNARPGSTGDAITRSMWSGTSTGNQTAEAARRRYLPGGSYRMVVVAGTQPGRALALLGRDAANSGTAQRWLFLPVVDAEVPDVSPAKVDPMFGAKWPRVQWGQEVEFPEDVMVGIEQARRDRIAGRVHIAALDEHADLQRMKVAAALARLHGTNAVSPALWEVATLLVQVSARTRASMIARIGSEAEAAAKAEGRRAAVVDVGRLAVKAERGAVTAEGIVTRHAVKHGGKGCSRRCLTQQMRLYREAEVMDAVIAAMLARGQVKSVTVDGDTRFVVTE